ncbi:MAG: hypothetical protein K0S61_4739 [Anaerocolumna sp.]|nr:hypothetical protein [Anaerocolumna sp.]
MPEYSHIQTYVKCNESNFAKILSEFSQVLASLGFDESYIRENFHGLAWEVCDNGFMYVGSNADSKSIEIIGKTFNVRPYVMGWTSEAIKSLNEPWLQINLLFETEELIESYVTLKYKPEVEAPLWHCMLLLSNYFSEVGTYLTDEITDGRSWETLMGEGNSLWDFDAAIIPQHLYSFYREVPMGFSTLKQGTDTYCIFNKVWNHLPWEL